MSAQFTPGPWSYDDTQKFYQGRIIRHNGILVAKVIDQVTTDTPEVEANAQLITAAPELLQACKYAMELVKVARQYFPKSIRNSDKFNLENTNATLGKAVFKAEGAK